MIYRFLHARSTGSYLKSSVCNSKQGLQYGPRFTAAGRIYCSTLDSFEKTAVYWGYTEYTMCWGIHFHQYVITQKLNVEFSMHKRVKHWRWSAVPENCMTSYILNPPKNLVITLKMGLGQTGTCPVWYIPFWYIKLHVPKPYTHLGPLRYTSVLVRLASVQTILVHIISVCDHFGTVSTCGMLNTISLF